MRRHPIIILSVLLVLCEVCIGFFASQNASKVEQRSLIERSRTVAAALDAREILELSGSELDYDTPPYLELKNKLVKVAEVNPDVTSAYVTGYRNGDIFFFADSVASGEVDEATPGLVYDEATDLFRSVFLEGVTMFEGPVSDRWGSWVSAIVPIMNESDDSVIASVGLDIDSSIYRKRVLMATAVPVLAFGVIFLIGLVAVIRYQKNKEMLTLRAKFVSIASHELRSPVSGVVWAAESLLTQRGVTLTSGARDIISQIVRTGRQVLRTVNDILDLAKLQGVSSRAIAFDEVDVGQLIRELVESLALVAVERKVAIRTDQALSGKLMLTCDKEKTQRVISNILTNAIKYSRPNGEVVIAYSRKAHSHVISIQDSGVGIPKAEQERVMAGGFRASNVERSLIEGSGFGLQLVKELMASQGGSVRFESTENIGTTFYIELKDR